MQYRLEYFPNPDCLTIHINKIATQERYGFFESPFYEIEKQPQFVKDLFRIDGVTKISLDRYSIHFTKGSVFEWDDIVKLALEVLRANFEPEGEIKEKGKPIRWTVSSDGRRVDIPDFD